MQPLDKVSNVLVKNWSLVGECWVWTGSVMRNGYGQYKVSRDKNLLVHRMAYECLIGPLDPGTHLHHICENKLCFNPDHLQVTDIAEHPRLHAPSTCVRCGTSNWWISPSSGYRDCRTCKTHRQRANRQAKRMEMLT